MNIALYSYAGFTGPLPSIASNFPIFPSRSHFGPDSGVIPIFGEHGVIFHGFTITSGFDVPASIKSLNFNGRFRYAIFIGLAMLLYNAYIAPILAMSARHSFAVPSNIAPDNMVEINFGTDFSFDLGMLPKMTALIPPFGFLNIPVYPFAGGRLKVRQPERVSGCLRCRNP